MYTASLQIDIRLSEKTIGKQQYRLKVTDTLCSMSAIKQKSIGVEQQLKIDIPVGKQIATPKLLKTL